MRHVPTGQLRQVLPARDVRLAQSGERTTQGPILMAMRETGGPAGSEREHGAQDLVVEITETQFLRGRPSPESAQTRPEDMAHLWQEFGI